MRTAGAGRRANRWLVVLLGVLIGGGPLIAQERPEEGLASSEGRLENGVRFLWQSHSPSSVVALSAVMQVPATVETEYTAGARELLRLLGQTTRLRPRQVRDLPWPPPALGVESTLTRDYVELQLLCQPQDLEYALVKLRSFYFSPALTAENLSWAQQRLLERQAIPRRELTARVHEEMVAELYPRWPGSWPLVGSSWSRHWDLDYLKQFHRRWYTPERLLVSVAGPVDEQTVRVALEQALGDLLPSAPRGTGVVPGVLPASGATVVHEYSGEVSVLLCGGRAPTWGEADYPAAALTLAVLGEGFGSRLYPVLRGESGLTYSYEVGLEPTRLCPYAYVLVSCEPAQAEEVRRAVSEQIQLLATSGATAEEVARARSVLSGARRRAEQESQQRAKFAALELLYPGPAPAGNADKWAELLEQVDETQIGPMCARLFAEPVEILVQGSNQDAAAQCQPDTGLLPATASGRES
jgi:predicted Zn-dependent peptidase